jgi:quercetin dioxygenase-like cupin family protein
MKRQQSTDGHAGTDPFRVAFSLEAEPLASCGVHCARSNVMQPSAARPPILVPPRSGRVLRAFGDEVQMHLGGAETGGEFCMFTTTTPPGAGPPLHRHLRECEWFLPLEGRVEFWVDGEWRAVALGTTVYIPRGTVHAFRNAGDVPLRMLIHTAPAGFDLFFFRCAEVFAQPGPPDMPRLMAIAAEHGIEFVGEK